MAKMVEELILKEDLLILKGKLKLDASKLKQRKGYNSDDNS